MSIKKYTGEFKYNLKLAWPVIAGMIGHTLVQFFDNVMVGQLGTAELAAVSLGNSFIFITMSIGIGFSTAITPLVAEADGAGNFEKGKQAFKHGILSCTVLGTVLFLVVLLSKPLMYALDQPDEVVVLAKPYLDLVAFSLIPLIVFQGFKQFTDGLSQTKYAMIAAVCGNILNVIINYLLIYGKFGFPELGIVGAAMGTLIARFVMVALIWGMIYRNTRLRPYISKLNFRVIKTSVLKKIIALGFPSALQMLFEVAIFTAAVWLSGVLGKNAQAANNIALNLSSFTFMFVTGLGSAAMIRVGNQKGLQKYEDLRRIARSFFLMGILLQTFFATLFLIFHNLAPWLYMDNANAADYADTVETAKIAAQLLIVAAFFQISDGVQVVVLNALRGMQDVKIPTLITFIAYWVIGFPISWYLGLHTSIGSTGIWIGLLAGLSASAVLLYIRFNELSKRLIGKK
jgi:MATE family multidrug resistance protein